MSTFKPRQRVWKSAGLVLIVATVLTGWWLTRRIRPTPQPSITAGSDSAGQDRPKRSPARPPPFAPPPADEKEAIEIYERMPELRVTTATLIGDVFVDKPKACLDEDVLISIQALPGHAEASFNVEGKFGNTLIVRPSVEERETFWIVAAHENWRDFRKIEVEVLPEDDARCLHAPAATIQATPSKWSAERYDIQVVPLRNLGKIVDVAWSFGDGDTASGATRVEHDYGSRPQTSQTSSFVVKAEVVDEDGRKAVARSSVSLANRHYQARELGGTRTLPVSNQRFPDGDRQGPFAASINNIESDPVRFETAKVRLRSCDGSGQDIEQIVPANAVLNVVELPPGQLAEAEITLDADWIGGDVCRVDVTVTGDTVPARTGMPTDRGGLNLSPVSASFSFDLGMPKTVAAGGNPEFAAVPVDDPQLEARLLTALKLLGTNHITDEQLQELAPSP